MAELPDKAARPDLCGGTGVTRFPTAIADTTARYPINRAECVKTQTRSARFLHCIRGERHGGRGKALAGDGLPRRERPLLPSDVHWEHSGVRRPGSNAD